MSRLNRMQGGIVLLILLQFSIDASAHHSFAIYDIDNRIERTGVLKLFRFSNPHIQLVLEVMKDDGSKETWTIESMNPRRWNSFNHPRDIAEVGETVTIKGWPARDGTDKMVLSSITTDRGEIMILNRVRQRRARENIPDITIKRE